MEDNLGVILDAFQQLTHVFSTATPEEAIKVACRQLLERKGVNSAPVPLKELGEDLGLRKIIYHGYGQQNSQTSVLRRTHGGYEILLGEPDLRNWRRSRFTVAHEIGHLLIIQALNDKQMLKSLEENETTYRRLERLCNLAAAELLMPERFLMPLLQEHGFSARSLELIYDRFLVSRQVMLVRIADVIPFSAIILWKRYARYWREKIALRVKACYYKYCLYSQTPSLPQHASVKNISHDIVTPVVGTDKTTFEDHLVLRTGVRKGMECVTLACAYHPPRHRELPIFGGIRIPDEPSWADAIMLIGNKDFIHGNNVWSRSKEISS